MRRKTPLDELMDKITENRSEVDKQMFEVEYAANRYMNTMSKRSEAIQVSKILAAADRIRELLK